jgi:hypothetical protein
MTSQTMCASSRTIMLRQIVGLAATVRAPAVTR